MCLESSSEDEYEEPSSEEESENVAVKNDDDGPVNDNAQVDFGFDDDFIGDSTFTLYSRRDIYLLKGWRAFVLERRNCAGFFVPDPPNAKKLNLLLRAISGAIWQRAVLSGSGEVIIEQLTATITGFSLNHTSRGVGVLAAL